MGRERTTTTRSGAKVEEAPDAGVRRPPNDIGSLDALTSLAGQIGNRAMTGVIQARSLDVGPVDDPAEREADRVAAEVIGRVQGRVAPVAAGAGGPATIRRRAPATASAGPAVHATVDPGVAESIEGARGGGVAISAAERSTLEPTFGASLASVRLHTDGGADRLSRSLGAEAFTTGTDIFFRAGAHRPGTDHGTELLAHELTHVVQQAGSPGRVHRRLARDGVFSTPEFNEGMPTARQGGQEEVNWNGLVEFVTYLEGRLNALAVSTNKLRSTDAADTSFGGRRRWLEKAIDPANDIVNNMPKGINRAQGYLNHEAAKTSGVVGSVRGLFRSGASKASKSVRAAQVERLLAQMRYRLTLTKSGLQDYRMELASYVQQANRAEEEGPAHRTQAMAEASTGAFGRGKGTVVNANFGSGAMGSVARVDYDDGKGGTFKGVFKPDAGAFGANDGGMLGLGTSESAPNLSMRSVAASRLNELLGMKVIPKTELGFHDQLGFGQVMALAGGRSPRTKVKMKVDEGDPQKLEKIQGALHKGLETMGQEVGSDGRVQHFIESTVTHEVDWDNPILKRELSNLQMMDALIGNIDRHAENYFIQVDAYGNPIGVLGIDNDLTFAPDKNDPAGVAFMQGHHAGLPPAVDAWTAEKMCAVTEDQVRKAVNGLITSVEVETLLVRLRDIKVRLEAKGQDGSYLIPRITSDQEGAKSWTELADPKAIKGAYFARERNWQTTTMKEEGRLLKPDQALAFKTERLEEIMEKANL